MNSYRNAFHFTLTESDVIVAAVIVPIAVMFVVLLLFVATLCWVYRAKRESRYIQCM